jgi:hypothetical protein
MKRAFETLYRMIKSMILNVDIELDQRERFWVEVAATATKLSNIMIGTDNKNPYERLYNNQYKYL